MSMTNAQKMTQKTQNPSAPGAPAAAQTPQVLRGPISFRQANALLEANRLEEAQAAYCLLLEHKPNDVSCWTNLGLTLRKMEKFEASAACYERALEIDPSPLIWSNYGNTLVDLDREEQALAAHKAAAEGDPKSLIFRKNYAIALREYHRFDESLKQFDAAAKLSPDDPKIEWERTMVLLHQGEFAEGWKSYEVRWQQGTLQPRKFSVPQWRGEDLAGKTLLVHEEQGFGDSILSVRYLPMVKARGGRVVFECKKPLHRLFSTLEGIDQLAEPNSYAGKIDYYVPLMSLPGIFGTTMETIPPEPKLHVPERLPKEAERLLKLGEGRFRVGIIWSGSTTFARNRKRATTADRFIPFAEVPGVQLYSLQKGPCEGELATVGGKGLVHELGPHVCDFADTAAILKHLDLVIMTDSAVAHLAGSVGCPVWNLLCYYPYWLYLTDREDSPWYKSMRLLRQETPGDWDGLFARTKAELAKAAAKKRKKKA